MMLVAGGHRVEDVDRPVELAQRRPAELPTDSGVVRRIREEQLPGGSKGGGSTGGRIMATLLHEMERRDAHIGLETMCIGGGQGIAAVVERI